MQRNDGIYIPPMPQPRPGRRKGKTSLFMGFGAVVNPDGTVAWQHDEWVWNALHDAGEQSMLDVYLREQANVTKFLALLNDAAIAETDGTMSAVTEMETPATDGYNRQAIAAGDWTGAAFGGDYRMTATEETFGPNTGAAWTATDSALCTTSTGAGLLLATLDLFATTTIATNQSFKAIFRWTQQ